MPKVNETLANHIKAVEQAIENYRHVLDTLQKHCEHPVILKHTDGSYYTTRLCEACGYYERVQWDSSYKYKDQRLVKRAYDTPWYEMVKSHARTFR